jgi:hypothetical protein
MSKEKNSIKPIAAAAWNKYEMEFVDQDSVLMTFSPKASKPIACA